MFPWDLGLESSGLGPSGPMRNRYREEPKVTRLKPVRPYSATLRTGRLGPGPITGLVIEFHQQKGHK